VPGGLHPWSRLNGSLVKQLLVPTASHGNTATCLLVLSLLSFTDKLGHKSFISFNVKEVNCLLGFECVRHDVEVNGTSLRLTSSSTSVGRYNLLWTSGEERAERREKVGNNR